MNDPAGPVRRAPEHYGWLGDAKAAVPVPAPRGARNGASRPRPVPVVHVPRQQAAGDLRDLVGRPAQPDLATGRVAPLAPNACLRYAVVRRMLPAGVTDVLEIGCGRGAFAVRLAARYNYLGIEPDRESWAAARASLRAAGRGEVRNIPAAVLAREVDPPHPPALLARPDGPRRFDLVCAFEVLEHIEDDAGALAQWAGLIRPGGWLLLSVPAHQSRFGPWDEFVGHFRRYDPSAISGLLARAGFTDVSARLYGFPLGYLLEPARNVIGSRRLAAARQESQAERTSGSGRQLQPSGRAAGTAIRLATIPFQVLQRAMPGAGTGLVIRARLADRPPGR
jgi:SAM-dependent methyltransferase